MQRIIVFFIGLSLVLGLWAYTKANGEEITACIGKNGLMHIIGEGFRRTECKDNETLLSWNTQGEKGDTGEQGEQGEKGDDGQDGSDAEVFHLFDGDDQDLGVLVRREPGDGRYTTHIADISVSINFHQDGHGRAALDVGTRDAFYPDLNCSGTPFINNAHTQALYTDGTRSFFLTADVGTQADRSYKSRRQGDGSCFNTPGNLRSKTFHEVTLPFTVSPAHPQLLTPPLLVLPAI